MRSHEEMVRRADDIFSAMQDGRLKFAILRITRRRAAGEITYDDVRTQLRSRLAENLATQRYLDHLRQSTYVDIREP